MKIAHWEITRKCNLNCSHCITPFENKKELSTEDKLSLIDRLSSEGVEYIYLTGGEPFALVDLETVINKIKSENIKIGIITNGQVVARDIIQKIDLVGLSFEGPNNKVNDKIRGNGSFSKAKTYIDIINSLNLTSHIYFTINRTNFNQIEKMINFGLENDFKHIKFNEITIRGRAEENKNELELSSVQKNNLSKIVKQLFNKRNINYTFYDKCSAAKDTIFINSQGEQYSCVEIYQLKSKPNIKIDNNVKCPYASYSSKKISFSLNNTNIKCPYA